MGTEAMTTRTAMITNSSRIARTVSKPQVHLVFKPMSPRRSSNGKTLELARDEQLHVTRVTETDPVTNTSETVYQIRNGASFSFRSTDPVPAQQQVIAQVYQALIADPANAEIIAVRTKKRKENPIL